MPHHNKAILSGKNDRFPFINIIQYIFLLLFSENLQSRKIWTSEREYVRTSSTGPLPCRVFKSASGQPVKNAEY